MFDLGTQELIVIFIVAFLVFGPKKLPELGRTLGKGIRDLKAAMRNVQNTFDDAGSEIKDEFNEAKSDFEESIFNSIESNVKKQENEKKTKSGAAEEPDLFTSLEADDQGVTEDTETAADSEEENKEKRETGKDG